MTKVLIVDDDPLVRELVRTVLTSQGLDVVGEADDGDQVLPAIAEHRPDVVLIDLEMRRVGGIEAIRQVAALRDGPRCVALTNFGDDDAVTGALAAGAAGFLAKDDGPTTLAAHLQAVAAGGGALGPGAAASVIRRLRSPDSQAPNHRSEARARLSVLTEKERAVARLVAGLTNAQIATRLLMSENTVKSHVGSILAKLCVGTRAEVAVMVDRAGIDAADERPTAS